MDNVAGKIKRKRMLKFWGVYAEEQILLLLGVVAALMVYNLLLTSYDSIDQMVSNLTFLFPFVAMLMLFVITITEIKTIYSIVISFGSTRKEAFWGQQLSIFLKIIQIMLLYLVMTYILHVIGRGNDSWQIPVFVANTAGFILVGGIAQFLGMISMKLGPKAAVIIMVLVCGGIGFAGGFLASFLDADFSELIKTIGMSPALIGFAISIIVYLVGAFCNYANMKNYEVKA